MGRMRCMGRMGVKGRQIPVPTTPCYCRIMSLTLAYVGFPSQIDQKRNRLDRCLSFNLNSHHLSSNPRSQISNSHQKSHHLQSLKNRQSWPWSSLQWPTANRYISSRHMMNPPFFRLLVHNRLVPRNLFLSLIPRKLLLRASCPETYS